MPTLSFAADIGPLFRPSDIETMKPIGLDGKIPALDRRGDGGLK